MTKAEEIEEFMLTQFKEHGFEDTPENRLDFLSGMNDVWDEWVPQGHTPPRATVEAKLANPAVLVEIVVTAGVR